MKPKNPTSLLAGLGLVLFLPFLGLCDSSQYVTVMSTNGVPQNFRVQTNQAISVVGYDWITRPEVSGTTAGGLLISIKPYTLMQTYGGSQIPQIITGLTNITVDPGSIVSSWVTFQITTPSSANVISNYIPANAVVIPSDATGPVQIVLESSSDLVNWVSSLPGTYGSTYTNRFFRVRAIAQ